MRIFIIGRIVNKSSRRLVAYKLYDADSGTCELYERSRVFDMVRNGIAVAGLKIRGGKKPGDNQTIIDETTGGYNTRSLDKLDGFGNPLEETGKEVLLNIKGFEEAATYRVVNSMGQERWINIDEFLEKAKDNKIVGVQQINGKISWSKCCTEQYVERSNI